MSTTERVSNKKTEEHHTKTKKTSQGTTGLKFSRLLTRIGSHPYDEVDWELRSASITNDKGEKILDVTEVEIPAPWSQLATNVVVSKYFRTESRSGEREKSVKQIIDRVVEYKRRYLQSIPQVRQR